MLKGIDISNWQAGIKPSSLDIDFCIVKATEGVGYTDPTCDQFVTDCIDHALLWGFYHFARENNPESEARYFVRECENYFGNGIPVLDYETSNADDCEWCELFMTIVHELTNVWPMLYISASQVPKFNDSWIPFTCGLWIAGYPYPASSWVDDDMPYSIGEWPFAAIWQFTSSLRLPGYAGNLDGDLAYMDENAWMKYAGRADVMTPEPERPEKTIDDMAVEAIFGEYGTGDYRKRQLGLNYDAVQARINEYYEIAEEVIQGFWGNGWNRFNALDGAGYNPDAVQHIVNEKLR